jgi:hypothetical protein
VARLGSLQQGGAAVAVARVDVGVHSQQHVHHSLQCKASDCSAF